jgi:hypothetical protein
MTYKIKDCPKIRARWIKVEIRVIYVWCNNSGDFAPIHLNILKTARLTGKAYLAKKIYILLYNVHLKISLL